MHTENCLFGYMNQRLFLRPLTFFFHIKSKCLLRFAAFYFFPQVVDMKFILFYFIK